MAKLDKYIKKELRKGISKARIKSALIQAGYKKEDINHSFQRFFPKKPMPPAIKYIVLALIIVGAGYGVLTLISDYLEQRPVVIERTRIIVPHNAILCNAVFEEDVQYFVSRANSTEGELKFIYILDFYAYLSLYKQDPSVLEDPYAKEIAAKHKEVAELFELSKPIIRSIISKEITSFEQCADEVCEVTLKFNKAIVEANPKNCDTFKIPLNKICQALATKNRNICDELEAYPQN